MNPNIISINLEYDEPVVGTIHLNYAQEPERHEYEIAGDRGWAVVDAIEGKLRLGDRQKKSVEAAAIPHQRDDLYRREHQAFFDAVNGLRRPESPPEDALVSMAVIEACRRSLMERKPVPVPSWMGTQAVCIQD